MTPEQFKALRTAEDNLTAVLCDPEGKCCISGSDADRRIIDDALDILRALAAEPEATPEPVVFVKYRKEGGFWSECHHLDTSAVPVFFHPPKEQKEKPHEQDR